MSTPTWFITGASNGFGLALQDQGAAAVEQIEKAGGSVIEMDMTESKDSITTKVQSVGRIDYLVNNAGYSILAACETITDKDAQLQLNTNFFGPLYVMQAALPGMRGNKSGTIINISSAAARDPLAACSVYAASKAALEAASESLAKELAPHNIRVLIVEPGNFRTNFVNTLENMSPEASTVPEYYDDPVGLIVRRFLTVHGKQIGNPTEGVRRIFEAATGEGTAGHLNGKVLRLILGSDCLRRIKAWNENWAREVSLQEETAISTDFKE
ncbi:hypothetical protein NLG97_g6679 [Lecanicillium saksenae]|uniref:Uncharacterized protein n=1 Tax=Lecanicillium saksenae TaxID=468837 RepID=A0ACC1QS24_9HYPO|nr:hypothetical protein NLG97_g6679 [Lecanicillium saksenae]